MILFAFVLMVAVLTGPVLAFTPLAPGLAPDTRITIARVAAAVFKLAAIAWVAASWGVALFVVWLNELPTPLTPADHDGIRLLAVHWTGRVVLYAAVLAVCWAATATSRRVMSRRLRRPVVEAEPGDFRAAKP